MTATGDAGGPVAHQIHFGWRENNLLGQGLGPTSTSLRRDVDYERLRSWYGRLAKVAIPEFAPGEAEPGFWFRRFEDGQGALLYRVPESVDRDRRGSFARAMVGPGVGPTWALLCAARNGLGGAAPAHEDWGMLPPLPLPSRRTENLRRMHGELDRDALSHPGLVNLVAAVLANPFARVDVRSAYGARTMDHKDRIVLLWGLYRALFRVLGRSNDPLFDGVDWSFSTSEPWSDRTGHPADPPRLAFRPPGSGDGPVDLAAPAPQDHARLVAQWLTNRLDEEDDPLTPDERARIRRLGEWGDDGYGWMMRRLHEKAAREGTTVPAPPRAGATRRSPADAPPWSQPGEEPATRTRPDTADEEATEEVPPPPAGPDERTEEIAPRPGAAEEPTEELSPGGAGVQGADPELASLTTRIRHARDGDELAQAVNELVHLLNPTVPDALRLRGRPRDLRISLTAPLHLLVAAGAALLLLVVCLVLVAILVT
ncbi:hypothetical protein ACIBFB_19320 [Nocardiopsis sp. NPDC050513]|uniref:hypothetical protein n=1 Tax=Nocardiopsis sp. NPDC050513 TaxID=3364338 RepID=UPI0037892935